MRNVEETGTGGGDCVALLNANDDIEDPLLLRTRIVDLSAGRASTGPRSGSGSGGALGISTGVRAADHGELRVRTAGGVSIASPTSPNDTNIEDNSVYGRPTALAAGAAPAESSHSTDGVFKRTLRRIIAPLRMHAARTTRTNRALHDFYRNQNEEIEALLKPVYLHVKEFTESNERLSGKVRTAIIASFVCNLFLGGLQLYAAISSQSLSFFATMSDSIFDSLSGILLGVVHLKSKRLQRDKYPAGGSRLESIGNIMYAFLMMSVSLILIVESIRALATHDGKTDPDKLSLPAIIAVAVAFGTKLLLCFYCFLLRKQSSQVKVLFEDHRNDLFVNGFGIFTASAGSKIQWWIDPMGAIIISLLILTLWGMTMTENFQHLAGKAAESEYMRLVIYKCVTFSDEIKQIDSCKVYHSGPNYFAEVDIVMLPNVPLKVAHDVSQELQDQLEFLPRIERAFVHVDYETDHKPEHSADTAAFIRTQAELAEARRLLRSAEQGQIVSSPTAVSPEVVSLDGREQHTYHHQHQQNQQQENQNRDQSPFDAVSSHTELHMTGMPSASELGVDGSSIEMHNL